MGIKFDTSMLEKGLSLLENRVEIAVGMYVETAAKNLEAHMKKNASWTDRTSEARRRLSGSVQRVKTGYRITLSHGVDYGVWLELAHNKNYAIIKPTLDLKSAEVIKGFESLLTKMKK